MRWNASGGEMDLSRRDPVAPSDLIPPVRRIVRELDGVTPSIPVSVRYDGDLSAESWKMHYIGLGHSLERIPRFAPGC